MSQTDQVKGGQHVKPSEESQQAVDEQANLTFVWRQIKWVSGTKASSQPQLFRPGTMAL